jgi:hypothetical protein
LQEARYFEYFWNDLDKWVFFLVLGIATLGMGILAERRLRRRRRVEPGPRQVP